MNMKTFVNGLTAFRAVAALLIIPCFIFQWFWLAFALFAIAGFTDLFDGILAKKYNVVTKLGGVADQIADKILVVTVFILLAMFWPMWFISVPIIFMIVRNIYVSGLREFAGTQKMEMPVSSMRIDWAKAASMFQMIAAGGFLLVIALLPITAIAMMTFYLWNLAIAILWIAMVASLVSAGKYTVKFWGMFKNLK